MNDSQHHWLRDPVENRYNFQRSKVDESYIFASDWHRNIKNLYTLTDPDGTIYRVIAIGRFCGDFSLEVETIRTHCRKNKKTTMRSGWRARRQPLTESQLEQWQHKANSQPTEKETKWSAKQIAEYLNY